MAGSPVAIGYNVPGVKFLVLNGTDLAVIFSSKITMWDAPAIRWLKPGVELPLLPIKRIRQPGTSGTTRSFEAYLAGASDDRWSRPGGKAWQERGGRSADGPDAAASVVKATVGSISYFELPFAVRRAIDTARIDTGATVPVAATQHTASASLAAATVVGTGKDLTLKPDYKTAADGTYPSSWSPTRWCATGETGRRPCPR